MVKIYVHKDFIKQDSFTALNALDHIGGTLATIAGMAFAPIAFVSSAMAAMSYIPETIGAYFNPKEKPSINALDSSRVMAAGGLDLLSAPFRGLKASEVFNFAAPGHTKKIYPAMHNTLEKIHLSK